MKKLPAILSIVLAVFLFSLASNAIARKEAPHPVAAPVESLDASPEGKALHLAWVQAGYKFTPAVKSAYIALAKAQTQRELAAAGKNLPADFLAWIDSDPLLQASVYGARLSPANVLLMLRSLEIDLGQDIVRKKYTQLAVAMAVVKAAQAALADISPREPLKLVIPTCPLKPVNTKDPNRTLDMNDHIINFLNDHAPLDKQVKVGTTQEGKKKVPVFENKKVPVVAADVLASRQLQEEFNAYMKSKGCDVEIDCGDHVIFPDRHDMLHGPEAAKILKAFKLFKAAYEAKGLLPPERDPFPSPAEKIAFLVRNDQYKFPADVKREWPRFPIATAPWPLMTLLAADNQPLRETEDIWARYRDNGELHMYGEYIGGIAQQFDFQSARRLSPYPFSYGTFQMMLKDGGVCGTMANMAVRTDLSLGVPATTAGQPGHCALISVHFNPKISAWEVRGGQFATGGPDQTHPHTPWFFGEIDAHRDMIYHQTVAWAVNYGFASYLDSTLAYDLFRRLSDADRLAHGPELLESGLSLNPYNFLLAEAVCASLPPQAQIHFYKAYKTAMAAVAAKPAYPNDGLYNQVVRRNLLNSLAKQPVPADKSTARAIYSFLLDDKCDNAQTLTNYQYAVDGLSAVLSRAAMQFKAHLASVREDAECEHMAQIMNAAAGFITAKPQRVQWAAERLAEAQGHEAYFGAKYKIQVDPAVAAIAKLAGKKLRADVEMMQPLLDQVAAALKTSIAGERQPKPCKQLADQITATAPQITDAAMAKRWAESLSKIMTGHEEYQVKNAKKNAKPLRDPCADAIAQLLAGPKAQSK